VATPKQFVYTVQEVRQIADVVVVKVNLDDSDAKGLDESLEGAAAWWPGPPRGFADVLSVDPDRECVNLRFVSPKPPAAGEKLFIYPPLYLEALRDWWRIEPNADAGIRWLDSAENSNTPATADTLANGQFGWLRRAQREAFQLPSWKCGFLEGPPGTGKTTTLGAILATYLAKFAQRRVLLLSTTNNAVDLALVAVDKALEKFPGNNWGLRLKCKRLGHHYQARNYEGRSHLIPTPDPALVKQLAELESKRPDTQDVVAYSAWKRQVEQLRAKLKTNLETVLRSSRLAALTTCGAMFWTGVLSQCAPFDLVVFDEASQVGVAYAMALATFGKRCLFAGDPAQLAPVVKSDYRQPRRWLGRSPFDAISSTPGASVFLDEQSRMHPEICQVVSDLFYGGKLTVARKENADIVWQTYRILRHKRLEFRQHVVGITVPASSTWSQKYRGPIRYDSAQAVSSFVSELVRTEPSESILVLTPFRAQRALLRSILRNTSKGVAVSTVHKAQGSERRTIIFDPVDGSSSFLQGDEARRLINVAFSRAEARLVVMLSAVDRQNPLFAHPSFRPATNTERATGPSPAKGTTTISPIPIAEPIESFINNPSFPRCLKGKRVKYKDIVGIVTEVVSGRITIEPDSGPVVTYNADFIKAMFANKPTPKKNEPPTQREWPEKECNNCGARIRLVKTASGWRPYELYDFRPHRCY
jgi:hypothetical protein